MGISPSHFSLIAVVVAGAGEGRRMELVVVSLGKPHLIRAACFWEAQRVFPQSGTRSQLAFLPLHLLSHTGESQLAPDCGC